MMIIDLDARRAQRRRVLDTGLIRFGDMSISCAIRNVSNGGFALDVGSQDDIPDKFKLFVVAEKKTHSCNVVWREGGRIGVVFG
jgi:PilZ domain